MAQKNAADAATPPQTDGTLAALKPRATWMPSEKIRREWDERLKQQSLFSARTTCASYLDAVKKRLMEVAAGTLRPQVAEDRLRETLRDLGYRPDVGFRGDGGEVPPAIPGSITDLSSSRRIQLILDTNVKQARSLGQIAVSSTPAMMATAPAWRLTRTGARKKPRGNWKARWRAAGASVGWNGALRNAMIALKGSPIWQALADGAGGYRDTIGSPYPPFAFGSGMAWVNVSRREWKAACQAEGVPDGLGGDTPQKRQAPAPQAPTKASQEAKAQYAVAAREAAKALAAAKSREIAAKGYASAARKAVQAMRDAETASETGPTGNADRLQAISRDLDSAAKKAEAARIAAEEASAELSEGRIRALISTPSGRAAFPVAMRRVAEAAKKAARDAEAAYALAVKRNDDAKAIIKRAMPDE